MDATIKAQAYAVAFYILIFLMIYASYGVFASTVVKWCKKPKKVRNKKKELVDVQPTLTTRETIKCYIPVWQPLEVQKALFGTYSIYAIVQPIAMVLLAFGLLITWVLGISPKFMFYAHIAIIVGYVIQAVVYGIITAHCAYIFGFSKLTVLGSFLIPIIFALYLNGRVPSIILEQRKGDRFKEVKDDGNTVIKQKSNKSKNTQTISKH